MMIDWNKYHQQFGARVGELMKISPDTVKGYQTLSAANSRHHQTWRKKRASSSRWQSPSPQNATAASCITRKRR